MGSDDVIRVLFIEAISWPCLHASVSDLMADEAIRSLRVNGCTISELREHEGSLLDFVRGSHISFPQNPAPPPSEELLRRRKYLQLRQNERLYSQLTHDVTRKKGCVRTLWFTLTIVRRKDTVAPLLPSLTIASNFIFAMFTAFVVGFVVSAPIVESMTMVSLVSWLLWSDSQI